MENRENGFGIIDLLISMALVSIILLGIYKYWIGNLTRSTQVIKISMLKSNAEIAFNNLRNDLRNAGFNPFGLSGSDGKPKFRIYEDTDRNNVSNLHKLRYSHYTDNPACTGSTETEIAAEACSATCDPATEPANPVLDPSNPQARDCCCTDFSIEAVDGTSNHKIIRKTMSLDTGAVDPTLLLTNACLALIFWDGNTNAPCSSQSKPCSKTVKLVLSVAPSEKAAEKFDMSGCLNSTTAPCCHIPDSDLKDMEMKPTDYVRMEKNIYLRNLQE